MTRPLGLAILLLPATSRQQINHVVCAGPAMGKFCVIAPGQNSWNCARLTGATLVTGWESAISVAAMSEVTARIQRQGCDEPIIDAGLPCQCVFPPCVSSDRHEHETRDNRSRF